VTLVAKWLAALAAAGCVAGVARQHAQEGRCTLKMQGKLSAEVSGPANAMYSEALSSSAHGFFIECHLPRDATVFGSDEGGLLAFAIDSIPMPGTYSVTVPGPRPVTVGHSSREGERNRRMIEVWISSRTAEHVWLPVAGAVNFADAQASGELRATFDIVFRRQSGASEDTTRATGSLETR
jgi:hypothetical protein